MNGNIDTVDENDLEDEVVELEFDDESVSYYIVDEDDNEIGVCLIENGEEVEYMYEDSEPQNIVSDAKVDVAKLQANEVAEGIKNMKGELETFKGDAESVTKELRETTDQLKTMLDDVKDSFRIFPKKKK